MTPAHIHPYPPIHMQKPNQPIIEKHSTPANLKEIIIDAIQDRKGRKIVDIDLQELETAPASEFVICQGNSTSQVSAIADNIREEVQRKAGVKPYNYDGYRNSQWIVIDYGNILVHVFLPDTREFYSIEDLWSDARINEIPDLD